MLCWVDRQEQAEIKAESKKYNIPLIFAKSYDEFKSKIEGSSFLVVSTKKARYKKLFDLAREFSNCIFHAFYKMDGLPVTLNEHYLFIEPNVSPNMRCPQYDSEELFTAFYKDL
jgi:hypothetical protein